MYLVGLRNEIKELFLNFVVQLSIIDGDYSEEEKSIIKNYCNEMNISENLIDLSKDIKILIDEINLNCNTIEKKIIIFEAIGLAMSDSNYDEDEKKFIMSIKDKNIDNIYYQTCEKLINDYIELQIKINTIVLD